MQIRYTASRPSAQWVRISWGVDTPDHSDAVSAALGPVLELPGVRTALRYVDVPANALSLSVVEALFAAVGLAAPQEPKRAVVRRWRSRRTAFTHQDVGIEAMLHAQRGLLADDMGLGKQHPFDTRVLTPTGWRDIGSIRVGDEVIGSQGCAVRVTGVFPQGVKPSFRVWFSDHSSVEAGPEHLWTVAHRRGGRVWEELVLTTDQLRTRAGVRRDHANGRVTALDLSRTTLHLPMLSAPVEFAANHELPVGPYTLGQLIANGGLAHGAAALTCAASDWPSINVSLATEGSIVRTWRVYGNTVHANVHGIVAKLRDLGLSVGSGGKYIPRSYLHATPAARIALLQGLMDGDGSISKSRNRLTYHTTSRQLASDVRELVECLGGIASVREYERSHEDKPTEYQVRLRLPRSIVPFRVERKLQRYKPGRLALPVRTVQRVEYVRDVESVCIAVAAEDQLYATEHAILTHNTQQGIEWAESVRRHFDCMRPAIILVKRPLQENWVRELLALGAVADRSEVCIVESRDHDHASFKPGRAYYLINPEIVRDWWSKLTRIRPCAVVMDEAHAYKDLRTNRATGASMLATSPFVLMLTGSPMPNRPAELWSLLNILHPYGWGAPVDFRIRYAGAYRTEYGFKDSGPTNVEELQARLEPFYLRREAGEVGLNMPSLTRTLITASWDEATMGMEHQREYRAQFGSVHPSRIKQAIVDGHASTEVLKALNALRKITSEAKVDATVECVRELVANGESVVIFVWQRAMAAKLAKKLKGTAVHGELDQPARTAAVDAFQSNGGVLVATYDTLAEGVTLTRARFVVHHDLHWVPKDIAQAERRVHRIGQTRPCLAIWVVLKDSIDELFAMALETKLAAISEVLGQDLTTLQDAVTRVAARRDVTDEVQALVDSWAGA